MATSSGKIHAMAMGYSYSSGVRSSALNRDNTWVLGAIWYPRALVGTGLDLGPGVIHGHRVSGPYVALCAADHG